MKTSIVAKNLSFSLLLAFIGAAARADEDYFDETRDTTTLFSFDNESIPFFQNLKLEMRAPTKHPKNPVIARGPDGAVDDWAVQFYGSIIRHPPSAIRHPETGKFRAWYCAVSKAERADKSVPSSGKWRAAYAETLVPMAIHRTSESVVLVKVRRIGFIGRRM